MKTNATRNPRAMVIHLQNASLKMLVHDRKRRWCYMFNGTKQNDPSLKSQFKMSIEPRG